MPAEPQPKPSFSPYRAWGLGLQFFFIIALVLAVVVMLNYLSRDYFLRLRLGTNTKMPLSPRTLRILEGITNQIKAIVYYDKDEPFYSTIVDVLSEYRVANPRISIQIVDYKRDPAAAQQLMSKYSFLGAPSAKNLVIFDCEGKRVKWVDGNMLTKFIYDVMPGEKGEYRRKPVAFEGERAFTARLLEITSPKPMKACFVYGHGEHLIESTDKELGYFKLATVMGENYIQAEPLSLLTNTAPLDCDLLVVAGPVVALTDPELEKIDQYLNQGGRLLALFNVYSLEHGETGLERILAKWGVSVSTNVVVDPENTSSPPNDVIVHRYSHHPAVDPLMEAASPLPLQFILPRVVARLRSLPQAVDAPHVDEVAFSGPNSYLRSAPKGERRAFPLLVAVEKGAIKGVASERGTTRIIVAGDSLFLDNRQIDSGANRDVAFYILNWLLDRPQLLHDVGPRPVTEYTLIMSRAQLQVAEWVLLGGMPGGVLVLGTLVWLRRRR